MTNENRLLEKKMKLHPAEMSFCPFPEENSLFIARVSLSNSQPGADKVKF